MRYIYGFCCITAFLFSLIGFILAAPGALASSAAGGSDFSRRVKIPKASGQADRSGTVGNITPPPFRDGPGLQGGQSGRAPQGPLIVATRSLAHKDQRCSIMVNYPQFGNEKVDQELDFWAGKTARTFINGVESLGSNGSVRYSMMVDYEISEASNLVASVIFRINTDMGGSDLNSGMVTFTYDLTDGRKLGIGDIFGDARGLLHFLSLHSYDYLVRKLGNGSEEQIKKGTSPDDGNFSLFALRRDGMVFFFPPFQVADGSLGEQQVNVSLSDLAPYAPSGGIWREKNFLFGFVSPKTKP